MANKSIYIFAFKSAPMGIRSALAAGIEPLIAVGHIGISLNGGKNILGFKPQVPSSTDIVQTFRQLALHRKLFPGEVTEDTSVFKKVQSAEINEQKVYVFRARVTEEQYKNIETGLDPDSKQPNYGFSKSVGGFNCGSYLSKYLGIDAVEESGVTDTFVKEIIEKGGEEWDGDVE